MWGLAITVALVLLAVVVLRVARDVGFLHWWVPLALLAGIGAADFGSGLVHWGADTWGRADLPLIGPRILVPFRVHHLNPDDFLGRRFLDTNGDVAALAIPVLLPLLFIPLDTSAHAILSVFGIGFCASGSMTNQIHQWAHRPSPPPLVRMLQGLRLVLRPRHHAIHHDLPYHAHYCITTGWCNRPLEAVDFFRRLECAITWITGAIPREDERRFAGPGDNAHRVAPDG